MVWGDGGVKAESMPGTIYYRLGIEVVVHVIYFKKGDHIIRFPKN